MDGNYTLPPLVLRRDGRLPTSDDVRANNYLHVPQTIQNLPGSSATDPAVHRAVFLWIVGHHQLFYSWAVLGAVCDAVTQAAHSKHWDTTTQWLETATVLSMGEVAAMINSGDFSWHHYREIIRPAMEKAHPAFAAAMSREFQQMAEAATTMKAALNAAQPLPLLVQEAFHKYQAARHEWKIVHTRVATALQPKDPELAEKLEQMASPGLGCPHLKQKMDTSLLQSQYEEAVANGCPMAKKKYEVAVCTTAEAIAAYDSHFGVIRADISTAAYLAQFRRVIEHIYASLRTGCLTAEQYGAMVDADNAIIAILTARRDHCTGE